MSWEDVLKAPIDLKWLKLIEGIKNDAMPKDKKKYVRYSNLDKINRNMVEYYFRVGKNKKKRQSAINGILEEMLRSSNARYDIEDKGGEDIMRSLKKKQTTLQGFDPKIVESLVEPDKSNFWIAPIEDSDIPNEEKSRLSDKMLSDLAKLNVGNKFTITSATGRSGQWGTEPSFMLTGVPTSLESKIYEMADKYNQDAIAVSAKGEKGAKFITPKGEDTDEFEDMEFDPDAEYSTDFPSGQRLTFKSLDKWKEILKWKPPSWWAGFNYGDESKYKKDDTGYVNVDKDTKNPLDHATAFVRPHYMFSGEQEGRNLKPTETEMTIWVEKVLAKKNKGKYWFWRYPDKRNSQLVIVVVSDKGDTLPSSTRKDIKLKNKTVIFDTIYPTTTNWEPKGVEQINLWDEPEGWEDRGQYKARGEKDLTTSLGLSPEELARRKEKARQKKLKEQREAFQKHKEEKKQLLQEQVDRKEISRFQANEEKKKLDKMTMEEYLIEIGEEE